MYSASLVGSLPGGEILLLPALPIMLMLRGSRAVNRQYMWFYILTGRSAPRYAHRRLVRREPPREPDERDRKGDIFCARLHRVSGADKQQDA